MEHKRATINDVAKMANTSVTTVSRVMNNMDYPVSSELRARIKEAAKQLNYTSSSAPKARLRTPSHDIGVVIPNITNPFYPETVLGIESAAYSMGFNVLLFNTLQSKHRENEYLDMLCERQVKGVIISPVENNINNISKYINRGMQFVLLDQKIDNASCPSISFDSRRGARMAVKYLLEKGHRSIAFASTPLTRWTRVEIHKGYAETLKNSGIKYDEELVFTLGDESDGDDANLEVDVGADIARSFIEKRCPATAILCVNDMVAFGVIRTLAEQGIRVPDDISVVGFDDIQFASIYMPSLTTIRYPARDTGRLAAMLLLENINNTTSQVALSMNTEPRIIERSTVKAI